MIRPETPSTAWQRFMERQYGVRIEEIKSYDSLYQANTAVSIVTNRGQYVVKRFRGNQGELAVLHRRVQSLLRKGCLFIPDWLKATDDTPFVRWQGQLFYVVQWVEGRPFQDSVEDAFALGNTLHALHTCGATPAGITVASFLEQRRRSVTRVLSLLRCDDPLAVEPHIDEWVQVHRAQCLAWLVKTEAELKVASSLIQKDKHLCSLIHGDVTSPNIVVTLQRLSLIDWESLGPGLAMEELAKAAANTGFFRPDLIRATLDGYQFWTLSHAEQLLFRAFFRIPREALHMVELIRRGTKKENALKMYQILRDTWSERLESVAWVETQIP